MNYFANQCIVEKDLADESTNNFQYFFSLNYYVEEEITSLSYEFFNYSKKH